MINLSQSVAVPSVLKALTNNLFRILLIPLLLKICHSENLCHFVLLSKNKTQKASTPGGLLAWYWDKKRKFLIELEKLKQE